MITELTARIEEWARERGLDVADPEKQIRAQFRQKTKWLFDPEEG